jgi:ABC-2 type transport system ATP-binding protein
VIQVSHLTKIYGQVEAVRDVSFEVGPSRITGFLGRNGAGKSTTIKILLGMVRPTSGTGSILGHPVTDPRENLLLRRRVAYVGEDKGLYAYMTVAELIRFTRSFYGDWRPEVERRLLRGFQLPANRRVKALSKGMRTKLALLLALARNPDLLILDEPTEGLDPVSIEELLQTLAGRAAEGTAVFFSSHQLNEVERIADDILLIDQGRLLLDISLEDLRENYRRVTLGFDGQPREEDFRLPGVARIRAAGRQLSLLTSANAEALVDIGRGLGAVSVDVAAVSLREVFLEMVQEPK